MKKPPKAYGRNVGKAKNALEAITLGLAELIGQDPGPDPDLKMVLSLLVDPDLSKEMKLQGWLHLLRYTRPTYRSIEHSGAVVEAQVQLSPKEIEAIMAGDPFSKAKEIEAK